MEETCDVRWYTFSWNDVLRLPIPEEARRTDIEVFIDREAETLGFWGEREPQVLGLFPWDWVQEELRIAEWRLGDWFGIFRDLRIVFYVRGPGGGKPSVHILAVREDGGDYLAAQRDALLESGVPGSRPASGPDDPETPRDELLIRYQDVLARLEEEPGSGTTGPGT